MALSRRPLDIFLWPYIAGEQAIASVPFQHFDWSDLRVQEFCCNWQKLSVSIIGKRSAPGMKMVLTKNSTVDRIVHFI